MTSAYEIKGIKSFKGHGGEPCSQGNLYLGTKKVCEWSDDAWGGSMRVDFVSTAAEAAFLPVARAYLSARPDLLGTPYDLAAMSAAHIAAEAVERMSYVAGEEAEMRKLCKNKLVVRVPSKHAGAEPDVFTINCMYTDQEVARIKTEHPDLVEVVNARFSAPLKVGSPEHLVAEGNYYRKDCQKKLMIVRNVAGQRTVFSFTRPYSPALALQVRAKHPDLLCILNEVCDPALVAPRRAPQVSVGMGAQL
jgi:hypothetical protein